MFYLDRRGEPVATAATKYDLPPSNGEENFGWWLSRSKIAALPRSRRDWDHRSPGSSASMFFYVDSDDSDDWTFAQEASDGQQNKTREKIELRTFVQDDLNIERIKRNAGKTDNWPAIYDNYNAKNESKYEAVRCSLERLILREEYRIPSPSSRCSSQPRPAPEVGGCRARSSCSHIDSGRIGEARPTTSANSRGAGDGFAVETRSSADRRARRSEMISSSRSTYDSLFSWKDTSGMQSSNYSSATQNYTPMCLCDELAIASRVRVDDHANNRGTAINEVASILKGLQNDPEKATVLLEEEDRFCDCRSSHDQLTRLALAIEMDAEEAPAILNDPNNWERQLRDKIERLQHGHREIRGDIRGLRGDFQCDERKIGNVLGDTAKLRGEIRELRYLDDLLTLIQGELARISRRNWPFVLGNNEPREEVNLIV